MILDQLIKKLRGKQIVRVDAEEWDEERQWLIGCGSVVITLSDGTEIHSLSEPLEIIFKEGGSEDENSNLDGACFQ